MKQSIKGKVQDPGLLFPGSVRFAIILRARSDFPCHCLGRRFLYVVTFSGGVMVFGFAIFLIVAIAQAKRIIFSNGRWLHRGQWLPLAWFTSPRRNSLRCRWCIPNVINFGRGSLME